MHVRWFDVAPRALVRMVVVRMVDSPHARTPWVAPAARLQGHPWVVGCCRGQRHRMSIRGGRLDLQQQKPCILIRLTPKQKTENVLSIKIYLYGSQRKVFSTVPPAAMIQTIINNSTRRTTSSLLKTIISFLNLRAFILVFV